MAKLANSWILLMLAIGAVLAIAGYLGYRDSVTRDPARGEIEEFPVGLRIASGRVPAVLWLVFAGTALGMIGYVLFMWSTGPNY